jgi:hypothetical protein
MNRELKPSSRDTLGYLPWVFLMLLRRYSLPALMHMQSCRRLKKP